MPTYEQIKDFSQDEFLINEIKNFFEQRGICYRHEVDKWSTRFLINHFIEIYEGEIEDFILQVNIKKDFAQ